MTFTLVLCLFYSNYRTDKRSPMMDLALMQLFDMCDEDRDYILGEEEYKCIQQYGHLMFGRK